MYRQTLNWALSEKELHGRMSFIAGPRQIGKTTAIQNFLQNQNQAQLFYNWDSPVFKKRYAQNPIFFLEDINPRWKNPWIAFDEIHKYPKWKNLLKGYYDEFKKQYRFVITGSARLDSFRKSGDSLVGRYFLFKLLPLGFREILNQTIDEDQVWIPGQELQIPESNPQIFECIENLIKIGGFPEPFFAGTEAFATKWREQHSSLIIREDLRDLSKINEIRKLETLAHLLPERVGSPLSINNLRQSLECAHATLVNWLKALELVYLTFSISPWSKKLSRSILKEEKYYFWDWGMVEDQGTRFENFIAVQLEKSIAAWNEWGKGVFELKYLRTKEGYETDFAICDRKKIYMIIEAKLSETSLSPHLSYFKNKTDAPLAIQVVLKPNLCVQKEKNTWLMGADRFLSLLV